MKETASNNVTEKGFLPSDAAQVNRCDSPANYADLFQKVMRLKTAYEKTRSENVVFGHIAHALIQGCISLFYVNMETGEYVEYSTDDERSTLTEKKRAADFFESCKLKGEEYVHPDDLPAFAAVMNREFLTNALNQSGTFEISYRRIKDGKPLFANMRITRMEDDTRFVVVAVTNVDEYVKKRLAEERMQEERLEQMRALISIDALTGIKNKHAYLEMEASLDRQIEQRNVAPFAVVMLDVNDLKKVNDTSGHQAGDELLRGACRIICDVFKHSPVYRVGGDEFTVIARGVDYEQIEERLRGMRGYNAEALQSGGIVIACGMAKLQGDACVATVFGRADRNMREDKCRLKLQREA